MQKSTARRPDLALLTGGAVALTLLAAPAFAQSGPNTFTLPPGCEGYLTVQTKSCSVEHNFICADDPEGWKQRVSLDERGITYIGAVNAEAEWVQSFHPLSGHSERLADNPADPASFSELIATDSDTYDFTTLSDEIGVTRYVGADTLTGRTVTIDGVELEESTYDITAYDANGTEKWSSRGNEFINRDFGHFFAGTGTITTPDGSFDKDDSPVEFIFPGEPGFLSANPKHGCGVTMSSYNGEF